MVMKTHSSNTSSWRSGKGKAIYDTLRACELQVYDTLRACELQVIAVM